MDFFELIRQRHSIRAYHQTLLDEKQLHRLLEAVNRAPSAGDRQAYEVLIVRDPARKRLLVEAAFGQTFIAQAPVVLVFCSNPARSAIKYHERGTGLYAIQDATIACTFAHLAAAALGWGSVWVGAFDEATATRALEIPPDWRPIALLPIGLPAEDPPSTPRRKLEDLVHECA